MSEKTYPYLKSQEEIQAIVNEINALLKNQLWFDFHIIHYTPGKLIIAGSIDLTYSHTLEIIFEGVFSMSCNMEWTADPEESPFILGLVTDETETGTYFEKFRVEGFHQLYQFKFIPDRFKMGNDTDFYVVAESISYNRDTVYYWKKENLSENERLADWLK